MKTAKIEVSYINHMGNDLSIVNAARVSFHKESQWENEVYGHPDFEEECYLSTADSKLIKYLAKHKHKSPFNHAFLSFRVKAPIFVARQLVKHKFLPWNEVSRRYVDEEPEFYFPEGWRKKAENVKQGSSNEKADWTIDPKFALDCLESYKQAISKGVCAEQARMVLPQNTMTEWVWSGSLGAFADMCILRLSSSTQKETREVAEKIETLIAPLFPVSWKYLMECEDD